MLMGRNIALGTHFEKLNKGWDAACVDREHRDRLLAELKLRLWR